MKTIKNVNHRKLALDKTTIRTLSQIELSGAHGGALSVGENCSEGLNFCQPDRRTARC